MTRTSKTRASAPRPADIGRRGFLALAGAGVTVAAVGGCGGRATQGPIVAGRPADFAAGAVRQIEGEPVLVLRDEGGLYAMSAVCPHMRCTVAADGGRLVCPCHGSAFDLQGAVLDGPAREPLEHYRVVVDERGVVVDTTAPVAAAERTPIEG
jgi:Rieske Fe-S protein